MAAETLIALVNMASALPSGPRSGKGDSRKQRKLPAGTQRQQKPSKKEAALSRQVLCLFVAASFSWSLSQVTWRQRFKCYLYRLPSCENS